MATAPPTAAPTEPTAPGRPGGGRRAAALAPDQRRDLIATAALPLLLRHGVGFTTRQVAEAAGIAEGTIFRAFPDKEALVDAVVAKAVDPTPVEARLTEIDGALPLEQRLVEAVRIVQDHVGTVWQVLSTVRLARPGPPRAGAGRPRFPDLRPLVALLEADRDRLRFDPPASARRLLALAVAGGHPALMGDEPLSAEDIVSLFLDGARSRPARRAGAGSR